VSKAAVTRFAAIRQLSATQVLLLINTAAFVVLAISVFWMSAGDVKVSSSQHQPVAHEPAAGVGQTGVDASRAQSVAVEPVRYVSWQAARSAFAKKDYAKALDQYSLLLKLAESDPASGLMRDFFQLRIGQCLMESGKSSAARPHLAAAAAGRSPAVRAEASYALATIDLHARQYLQARRNAYQAAAAYAAVGDTAKAQRDCDFLVARALTQKALFFHRAENLIPWRQLQQPNLLGDLDESDLRKLLAKNTEKFADAMLQPKVQRVQEKGLARCWTVTCLQAPLAEVLAYFVTKSDMDLQWASVDQTVRERAVTMYLPRVSGYRLCELATGSVGLLGRFTGDRVIVYNPQDIASLDRRRNLIANEALSAWRRLFLRAPDDKRIAEGYFALGVLQEYSGETVEAINHYQLTAQQFSRSAVAPAALLRSAKLLTSLRDYANARQTLIRLLDGYPNCRESGEAYTALGEATMKAGLYDEAFKVFKKLYYLELSASSKSLACLGAAKCLRSKGDHEEAIKWASRFTELAGPSDKDELPRAYLLLGKCYVNTGRLPEAIDAFRRALAADPKDAERVDILVELSIAYRKAGDLPKAVAALRSIPTEICRDRQYCRVLLNISEVYREMGLPTKAASLLRGADRPVSDPALLVELARCYRQAGRLTEAYDTMTDALGALEPGELAQEAACDLAEICLEIDKPSQAIAIVKEVLKSSINAQHQRARKILAATLLARKDYHGAALALADMLTDQRLKEQQ